MIPARKLVLPVLLVLSTMGCLLSVAPGSTPTPTPPTSRPTASPTPTVPPATPTPSPTETPTPAPVGTLLAYLGLHNGHSHAFTVELDYGTVTQLTTGSSDHDTIAWFPDGERLMYSEYQSPRESIWTVSMDGSDRQSLVSGDRQSYVVPSLSPDGTHIAFFSTRAGHWAIYVVDADGGAERAITDNTVFESIISWSPDGSQMAFTPWHNTVSPPFIGVASLQGKEFVEVTKGGAWDTDPKWSANGEQIAFGCYIRDMPQICSIRPDGSDRLQLTSGPGGNSSPAWSPDSQHIAFVSWRDSADPAHCQDGDCDFEIYVMDADGLNQVNLTLNPAEDWYPSWSPDGLSIAFVSLRDEPALPSECGDACNSEIYIMDADGANVRRLTDNTDPNWSPVWRPLIAE